MGGFKWWWSCRPAKVKNKIPWVMCAEDEPWKSQVDRWMDGWIGGRDTGREQLQNRKVPVPVPVLPPSEYSSLFRPIHGEMQISRIQCKGGEWRRLGIIIAIISNRSWAPTHHPSIHPVMMNAGDTHTSHDKSYGDLTWLGLVLGGGWTYYSLLLSSVVVAPLPPEELFCLVLPDSPGDEWRRKRLLGRYDAIVLPSIN